jgi:hypothetical protein
MDLGFCHGEQMDRMERELHHQRKSPMLNAWLIASLILESAAPTQAAPPPTQVMILGTFHMANPGRDVVNPSVKDIMGKRRQKEILEVVELLKKFRPTKIALESPPGSPAIQKRLEKYLAGEYVLTASEKDQIGLRLAKNMNHRAVYGIDFDEDLGLDRAFRYAEKNPQDAVKRILSELETKVKSRQSNEFMEKHSVRQILAADNAPEMDDLVHRFYMGLLRVGKGKDYPGQTRYRAGMTAICASPHTSPGWRKVAANGYS